MTLSKCALAAVLMMGAMSAQSQGITSGFGLGFEQPKTVIAGQGSVPPEMSSILADRVRGSETISAQGDVPIIRAEALQEAAASLGARAGLARRAHDIAVSLENQKAYLESVYDFRKLALAVPLRGKEAPTSSNGANGEYAMVLPPVILDGRDADSIPNEDEMRIAERVYKIHTKARLVPVDKKSGTPAMPNWRDYLIFTFQEVQMPHPSLLPKTEGEKKIWNEWAGRGWKEGLDQGQRMFDNGISRLNRDFHGMLKYRLAYAQGVVTAPQVAGVNMGVTGGGNEMRVNDRIVRITDHSSLVRDNSKWIKKTPD